MWVAFLTSYLKDYWPCLVLGASLVYYLVHLEASLEHQEAGQAYPLMKESLQLAFLQAYHGCFVASQGHLVFLRAYRAYFQVQMMAFFLLLGS